jgi:hypothetical protein
LRQPHPRVILAQSLQLAKARAGTQANGKLQCAPGFPLASGNDDLERQTSNTMSKTVELTPKRTRPPG